MTPEHHLTVAHVKREAVCAQAKSEIVSWLAAGFEDSPNATAAITNKIVGQIADKATDTLFKNLEIEARRRGELEEWRRTVNNHFLCALLATFACEVMKAEDRLNAESKRLASAIGRTARQHSFVSEFLVQLAVRIFLDEMVNIVSEVTQYNNFKRALRLSAILTCPDPAEHTEVCNCCIKPLGEGIISDSIKRKLLEALPA